MKSLRLYQKGQIKIGEKMSLSDSAHRHLKVLRPKIEQEIELFNGDGLNYTAKILTHKKNTEVQILAKIKNQTESSLDLTLAQAIPKGEKMDFLLQKSVELGITKIIPIISERVVVRLNIEKSSKKLEHWQKIIISAVTQSGRSIIPEITPPILLPQFFKIDQTNTFILNPKAKTKLLKIPKPSLNQATILIGPEGGFSDDEIKAAKIAKFNDLNISSRILRTETAALATIANMQLLWGN